jgi:membrane-bound serine protease (ClpP class)
MRITPQYAVQLYTRFSWRERGVRTMANSPFALTILLAFTLSAGAQEPQGEWIVVPGVITSEVQRSIVNDTQRAIQRKITTIVYEFQSRELSDFGPCFELAKFLSEEIKGTVQTFAVVDGPVNGHAVLPILACRTVYLTPNASLGFDQKAIERNRQPDVTQVAAYQDVGARRGRHVALLMKMLKPELTVYRFDNKGQQFRLSEQQVAEFNLPVNREYLLSKDDARFQPQEFLRAATLGVYKAEEAERLGLVNRVYPSKPEISSRIGVPMGRNPLPEQPRAAVIEISGDSGNGIFEMMQDKVRRALAEDVHCIIFHLSNMNGGPETVTTASQVAHFIHEKTRVERRIKTVAFIPENCTGTANFIVLACDEIVMGPEAKIGDVSNLVYTEPNQLFSEADITTRKKSLASIAKEAGYAEIIVRGMFERELEIVKARETPDPNKPQQSLVEELRDKRDIGRGWEVVGPVKKSGELLVLDAARAVNFGIARISLQSKEIDGVYSLYGISARDVTILRAGWLDNLVFFLQMPVVTTFLAIIAFTCVILEFKAPGTTVPLIIAALCFLLLFWAHSWLAGQVNALAILLFLLGFVLLGVEVFVLPGFGVTGVSGIVLMLLGLSLLVVKQWPTTQEEYLILGRNFGIFAGGLIFSVIGAFTIARYLPHIPIANRLMLPAPDETNSDAAGTLPPASSPSLLGAVGTAVTELRPAGRACFGDEYIDVTAESGYVDAGKRVQIIEIDGLRVVVKPV